MFRPSCSTVLRRWKVHGTARRIFTDTEVVRDELRSILRETAQPVAVVTSFMDPATQQPTEHPSRFHGATLSSFSSISMDPHPLVAFSLRIPSRMATSLTSAHTSTGLYSHMVINILSEHQAPTAQRFSRADLYPEPFVSLPYSLTEEGLPILDGAVGAMSCRLVAASWPLHNLESLKSGGNEDASEWKGEGVASELFIAQVIRVERMPASGSGVRPLLYHRRGYVTTSPSQDTTPLAVLR
ncbi:flavin reductase like domain-containing protein [Lenzites betulinus]|nr:flavin reductase like domain-containing protein [Lenzites betulinus]